MMEKMSMVALLGKAEDRGGKRVTQIRRPDSSTQWVLGLHSEKLSQKSKMQNNSYNKASEKHKTLQKEKLYQLLPVISESWRRINCYIILILLIIEYWTVVEQKRVIDLTQQYWDTIYIQPTMYIINSNVSINSGKEEKLGRWVS